MSWFVVISWEGTYWDGVRYLASRATECSARAEPKERVAFVHAGLEGYPRGSSTSHEGSGG